MNSRPWLRGLVFVVSAELWFSLASFFTKLSWTSGQIPGAATSFFRFVLGFGLGAVILWRRGEGFKPQRLDLVTARGFFNSIALVVFALALQGTDLSKANTLNMTYPVFVFLLAPLLTGARASVWGWGLLGLTLGGTTLILRPDFSQGVNLYDALGLASGILAAFGVTTLNIARRYDHTFMILFWMMGIGALVSGAFWGIQELAVPSAAHWDLGWPWVLAAGLSGVLGQVFITYGYGFLDAKTGSVLSTSRILFTTVLGMLFFLERPDLWTALGMTLIAGTLVLTGLLGTGKKTVKADTEG